MPVCAGMVSLCLNRPRSDRAVRGRRGSSCRIEPFLKTRHTAPPRLKLSQTAVYLNFAILSDDEPAKERILRVGTN